MTNWLIALGAGLVAAVVFVSANSGPTALGIVLFALTPLPIALVGLGWGWRSGSVAGLAGIILSGALTSQPMIAVMFALTQALPMVVLVYLAGLSRPIASAGQTTPPSQTPDAAQMPTLEWYPIGRIVLWACGIGALISVGLIYGFSVADPDFLKNLEKTLAEGMKANLAKMSGDKPLSDADLAAMSKVAVSALPAGGAIALSGSLMFSLWIAGRVAAASDQLQRPWPDIAALDYPTGTALALLVALGLSFLPAPWTMVAAAAIGAMVMAYLLLGLAVVHYTTRGNSWRPFILWALYIGVLFAQGVGILVVLLGLAEAALRLRARFGSPPDITNSPSNST